MFHGKLYSYSKIFKNLSLVKNRVSGFMYITAPTGHGIAKQNSLLLKVELVLHRTQVSAVFGFDSLFLWKFVRFINLIPYALIVTVQSFGFSGISIPWHIVLTSVLFYLVFIENPVTYEIHSFCHKIYFEDNKLYAKWQVAGYLGFLRVVICANPMLCYVTSEFRG